MKTIFLDTVGILALFDQSDQWQQVATMAMQLADRPGTRFVTTTFVLLECGNAAARKRYREQVCLLRDQMRKQNNIVDPSEPEIESAWVAYRRDYPGGASIVDHISFVIMRRLNVADAFTNDRHFRAAGFNTLF